MLLPRQLAGRTFRDGPPLARRKCPGVAKGAAQKCGYEHERADHGHNRAKHARLFDEGPAAAATRPRPRTHSKTTLALRDTLTL